MLLDIWVIFAAGLALLLALAGTATLVWRSRAAGKSRVELELRCEAARVALEEGKALLEARAASRDWKQQLTSRLEALDADAGAPDMSPAAAVRRLVLRAELTGESIDLEPHLSGSGGAGPEAAAALESLKAAHAVLEAEVVALRSAQVGDGAEPTVTAPANIARERELKALVQQFTRDSREMLTCIQALESENQTLRGTLGAKKSAA